MTDLTVNITKIINAPIEKIFDADTTQIKLTHVKFIDEESRSNHEGGWSNILGELEKVCAAD